MYTRMVKNCFETLVIKLFLTKLGIHENYTRFQNYEESAKMSNIYVETAETIKNVMNVGFDFTQALRIHRLVNSHEGNVSETNKSVNSEFEELAFIGELFNLGIGETTGQEAYKAYCNWAIDNKQDLMSQTAFGMKLSQVVEKKRTKDGIVYSMEVV